MTVAELISKLQLLDPELNVLVRGNLDVDYFACNVPILILARQYEDLDEYAAQTEWNKDASGFALYCLID